MHDRGPAVWLVIANPILGAVFALVGGKLRKVPTATGGTAPR